MCFVKLLCPNGHIMSFPHNESFGLNFFLFMHSFIKYRKHGTPFMFNCSIETQLGKHLKKISEDHKHVECVTYIYG